MTNKPLPMSEQEFEEIAARIEAMSATNNDAMRLAQERSRLMGALNHVHAEIRESVLEYIDEVTK